MARITKTGRTEPLADGQLSYSYNETTKFSPERFNLVVRAEPTGRGKGRYITTCLSRTEALYTAVTISRYLLKEYKIDATSLVSPHKDPAGVLRLLADCLDASQIMDRVEQRMK